ncbi:MAG: calcium-binding protein [Methyloceanibacter sp.]|uniref:calcium-binding protein n=1 Tax=Methyloceanibacter sp. TaxID=1965321 RepID=UPI003D6D1208
MTTLTNLDLVGSEVQVNTNITGVGGLSGVQSNADVTTLGDGSFLVVFQSANGGASAVDIHAQAFNADGTKLGDATRIANLTGDDRNPVVSSFGESSSVSVWQNDTTGDLHFTLFNPSSGTLFGTQTLAADTVTLHDPDIATFGSGLRQIVVWERDTASGNHDIQFSIMNGVFPPPTTAANVNAGTASQTDPAVAASGTLALIVYVENGNIRANLYNDADGSGLGEAASFDIADNTNSLSAPDVTALTDGRFVVLYMDSAGYVLGRFYDPSTGMTSDEFTVAVDGGIPRVSATPDGGFLAVWDDVSSGIDGDIAVRRFDADGNPAGDGFLIPDPQNAGEDGATVAINAAGEVFIAWTSASDTVNTTDTNFGIQGYAGLITKVTNGTPDADLFEGYAIDETINGLDSDDEIHGNGGNDILDGGDGLDRLYGGDADDILNGGLGDDTLEGGEGNDILIGGAGLDIVNGSAGDDTIVIMGDEALNDTMSGDTGDDTLQAIGAVQLAGFDAAASSIEHWLGDGGGLTGTSAANTFDFSGLLTKTGLPFIDGGGGNDSITGSGFADMLRGGGGNDALTGGAGKDILTGGAGRDMLFGGTDADRFDFNKIGETKKGGQRDKIMDFSRSQRDKIDLRDIDAQRGVPGDQRFKWIDNEKFHKKAGELHYKKKAGFVLVEGDINGDGKADFQIQVDDISKLIKSDFLL